MSAWDIPVQQAWKKFISTLTWRNFLVSQAMAASLLTLRVTAATVYYPSIIPATFFISGIVITEITALSVLLATLFAQPLIRRGVWPLIAYAAMLLMASAGSGIFQWYVRSWLGLQVAVDIMHVPLAIRRTNMLYTGMDTLVYGAFFMLVYAHWQRELHFARQVQAMQLQQLEIEQQLTRSQLVAAQMEIDPELVLATLGELRDLYRGAAANAEQKLDEFIQGLRERSNSVAVDGAIKSGVNS